jgi:hypothetical protein
VWAPNNTLTVKEGKKPRQKQHETLNFDYSGLLTVSDLLL